MIGKKDPLLDLFLESWEKWSRKCPREDEIFSRKFYDWVTGATRDKIKKAKTESRPLGNFDDAQTFAFWTGITKPFIANMSGRLGLTSEAFIRKVFSLDRITHIDFFTGKIIHQIH